MIGLLGMILCSWMFSRFSGAAYPRQEVLLCHLDGQKSRAQTLLGENLVPLLCKCGDRPGLQQRAGFAVRG